EEYVRSSKTFIINRAEVRAIDRETGEVLARELVELTQAERSPPVSLVTPARLVPASTCVPQSTCDADCRPGNAVACTGSGEMLAGGFFGAADLHGAAAAYARGCDGGDPRACMLLAIDLYQGSTADQRRAAGLLTRSCEGEDGRGCFNLGEVLEDQGG